MKAKDAGQLDPEALAQLAASTGKNFDNILKETERSPMNVKTSSAVNEQRRVGTPYQDA